MTVVVVGSINADLVLTGERIPAPGETRAMHSLAQLQGGKGANQAAAAASLGADVRLIAATGDDAAGRTARADLEGIGVDVAGVSIVEAPTGLAVIMVDDDAENSIAIVPGANSLLGPAAVETAIRDIAAESAVLVLSLEIPMPAVVAAATAGRRRGWRVILNPAPAAPLPPELLAACDVVTPNVGEAAELGGAEALLAAGAQTVVVTRGPDGADLHQAHETVRLPVVAADAVDTTGAGDAFTAGLAVALDAGADMRDAVGVALAAGAIATEAPGARGSLPTAAAVDARKPA
ncbi:MAG: ribokinase [Protaetiibacter sp.]